MAVWRTDVDAARFHSRAISCERRNKRTALGQYGIEGRLKVARQMDDHENRCGKVRRKFLSKIAQRFEAAGGGSNRQNVSMGHRSSPSVAVTMVGPKHGSKD